MKEPTSEEIKSEIDRLKEMKPSVLPRSAFGDDHHAAIDAQIQVLESIMDEYEVDEKFGDDKDNIRSAAFDAVYWMCGDADAPPSEDWKSLVR